MWKSASGDWESIFLQNHLQRPRELSKDIFFFKNLESDKILIILLLFWTPPNFW